MFIVGAGFVDEGSLSFELTILVEDVSTHEISELELGKELSIFETEGILELFFGDTVEDVIEDLLVGVVDQLVDEGALAFMTPQSDQEESGVLHVLEVGAVLDDLVLFCLSNSSDSTEDTSELTDGEHVMELGGSGQKSLRGALPEADGCLDQRADHADDLFRVGLLGKKLFEDSTVDTFDGLGRGRGDVEGEEQSLDTVRHIITSVSGVSHSSKELEARDPLGVTSLLLIEEVEAAEVNQLTGDLESNLILPFVNLGHGEVIKEDHEFLVLEGTVVLGVLLLDISIDRLLEVVRLSVEGEVDSLEGVFGGVETRRVHQDDGGLSGTRATDKEGVKETDFLSTL